MDAEKRKLENDQSDEASTDKKKQKFAQPEEGKNDVDEEVEEFFAILRRIQSAVKYFQKVDDSGRKLKATINTWKPSFRIEDFGEDDGVKDGEDDGSRKRKDMADDNSGFDLNSEPARAFEKGEQENVI